jgi:hypothetical protein
VNIVKGENGLLVKLGENQKFIQVVLVKLLVLKRIYMKLMF